MIDTTTRQSLRVLTNGGTWPYMMVPFAQLNEITAVFDANQISYWVDEEVLSIDGEPEVAVINFEQRSNPVAIQQLLDSTP